MYVERSRDLTGRASKGSSMRSCDRVSGSRFAPRAWCGGARLCGRSGVSDRLACRAGRTGRLYAEHPICGLRECAGERSDPARRTARRRLSGCRKRLQRRGPEVARQDGQGARTDHVQGRQRILRRRPAGIRRPEAIRGGHGRQHRRHHLARVGADDRSERCRSRMRCCAIHSRP